MTASGDETLVKQALRLAVICRRHKLIDRIIQVALPRAPCVGLDPVSYWKAQRGRG